MGIHIIKMPDIGEGIAEVELVEWHVQPGDQVSEDQLLADVMTDKATVEVPSPVVGKVVSLGGNVGDVMAVGAELIRLEVDGAGNAAAAPAMPAATVQRDASADAPTPRAAPQETGPVVSAPAPSAPAAMTRNLSQSGPESGAGIAQRDQAASASAPKTAPAPAAGALRQPGEKPLASPAVRQRAADQGIDLRYVAASGKAGQITHADLDAHVARGGPAQAGAQQGPAYAERNGEHAVPVIGLRRKIAQKMQESKRRIPHFSYVEEVDVTELEALRGKLNARFGDSRGKLTLLPLLIRAIVLAVREFPQVNARFDDEAGVVTQYDAVHMGVAAQTDAGLMVPVLRHAEALDLWSSAARVARLAEAARTGKIARDEVAGSTITISSLGALGGIVSTPVINYPEVAIVGINRMVERPVIVNGSIVARKMMNLSSSFDHRVVDGMHAAEFIQVVRAYLECPATLFVE